MKLLFCALMLATACFAGDYSETKLLRHAKIGDQHAYLFYDWKGDKFFALLSDTEITQNIIVEDMIDNSFFLSFKAAKEAFPKLKGYRDFYGMPGEDEKEMSIKKTLPDVV